MVIEPSMTSAMAPEEYIDALYHAILGRSPDRPGLQHWANVIRTSGDPTCVLKGILNSPEYLTRVASQVVDCRAEVSRAMAGLDRRLYVVDVGAQSLGADTHPYAPLLEACDVDIMGFDPLVHRLRERAEAEPASGLTLLPYAVGDGGNYTLHINNEDGTSSLFPLHETHNACFNHLSTLRTVRTEQVSTRRLDDILPERPVDFLKLDVQGAELMALRGAEKTLARTAAVHCEVEFCPIYRDQPLFPEVCEYLLSHNFILIDLLIPGRYHYLAPSGRTAQDRLLWADAVFFRVTDDPETQRVQALVAASVYRKPTLAEHLLILSERESLRGDRP